MHVNGLLLAGFVAGPVFGWLDTDPLFGDVLSEIHGHGAVVRNLVTSGVIITGVTSTLAAYRFLGWDIYLATLFGAIVTVSGPNVIVPLLRTVSPNQTRANILRREGILVDPLGAILALLVFDFIAVMQTATTHLQLFGTLGRLLLPGVCWSHSWTRTARARPGWRDCGCFMEARFRHMRNATNGPGLTLP